MLWEQYSLAIITYPEEIQCSPQTKLKACYWKGIFAVHIKGFAPTPIPHQRKTSTEGILP